MNTKMHKLVLVILMCLGLGLWGYGMQDPKKMIAAEEAKQRQEQAQRLAEQEQHRQAMIAQAKKDLWEKRAKMPPFSFGGFLLSDSPQQAIEKGLSGYSIKTTFPVEQKGNIIARYNGSVNLGSIAPGVMTQDLEDFFIYHRPRNQFEREIRLGLSSQALKKNIFVDIIDFSAKQGGVGVRYYYVTLPGESPRALYMQVSGEIIRDVPSVFEERYGSSDHVKTTRIWRSNKELAMTRIDLHNLALYIFDKETYDTVWRYVEAVEKEIETQKQDKEKAETEVRRSKI